MSVDLAASRIVSWRPGVSGATVTLTVLDPSGSDSTPSVTEESGVYSATLTTTQPGQYQLRWTSGNATVPAFTDVLNVWPEAPRYLLSLDDARRAATGGSSPTSDDRDIQLYNASGTVVIEDVVGQVLATTFKQETDGGRPAINLWRRVVTDGTVTVKVNGVELVEEQDFIVDRAAMIVYAGSRTAPSHFPYGRLNVEITYTAGFPTLPPNIEQAAHELIRHQWQVGKQAVHAEWSSAPSGDDTLDTTPSGYLIPRRVLQLCRATPKLPSF